MMSSYSVVGSLPTSAEIKATAIKEFEDQNNNGEKDGTAGHVGGSSGTCRRLLVQALQYGTQVGIASGGTTTTTESLSDRTKQSCEVLIDAWKTCPALEDPLVDALWLVASMLSVSSSPSSSSTTVVNVVGETPPADVAAATTDFSTSSTPSSWQNLASILSALVRTRLTPDDDERMQRFAQKLQANLFPVSILEDAGLLPVPAAATTTIAASGGGGGHSTSAASEEVLKKMRILNTQTHYKQTKYSLMQEESEGYAKMLQFLVTGSGSAKENGVAQESNDDNGSGDDHLRQKRRSDLMKLVGTFELDPNRVLDLTLDVLESTLYPTLDCTGTASSNVFKRPPEMTAQVRWLLEVMKEFSLDKLPPLIGFKLDGDRKAQKDTAATVTNGSTSKLNDSLTRTVAFLVMQNLVDLKTLVLDYCSPKLETEIGEAYNEAWHLEKKRIHASTKVSLSGSSYGVAESPQVVQMRERLRTAMEPLLTNQGLSIVLVLLQWGQWEHAKSLLSLPTSWSHLCFLMPQEVGAALCDETQSRILKLYQENVGTPQLVGTRPVLAKDIGDGSDAIVPMDTDEPNGKEYILDQVIDAISEPVSCIIQTGCIASRPDLYCQLCRLLRSVLGGDAEETDDIEIDDVENTHKLSNEAFDFFKTFLVPSLSLFPRNPAIAMELWSILNQLPYGTRYRLYKAWEGTGLERASLRVLSPSGGKPLCNVESELVAGKAARSTLKRLTKDNVRDMGRDLVKDAHANPLVVYTTILNQIESYDNLCDVMVQSQQFANPLGLDVLGYSIVRRLSGSTGGVNRGRLKDDGVNVSQWLQSLETFTGEFYKQYPFVESRGVLSYLMRRLRDGHVMELGILRSMLKVAGGYSFADYTPAAQLNDTQLEGRAGSTALKRETMSFGIVEKTNSAAARRLRRVLQAGGFGASMLILIAQARDRVLFDSSNDAPKDVKLIGNLYDSCQAVVYILLEFLTTGDESGIGNERKSLASSTLVKLYAHHLPTLQDIIGVLGLDTATAWLLCRPPLKAALQRQEMVGDITEPPLNRFLLTETTRESYSKSVPDYVWSFLSPRLFEFFYMQQLHDVFLPEKVYTDQSTRIDKELENLQTSKPDDPLRNLNQQEVERLKQTSRELAGDLMLQKGHVKAVSEALDEVKADFFVSEEVSQEAARIFLIHCVYPRSIQSPDDAMYASQFALRLHKLWTPGFSTMHYLDELISVTSGALFGVTEGEAANLAILLWQTWMVVNRWRYENEAFSKEVSGKPGSYIESDEEDGKKTTKALSHKTFIDWYNGWHAHLGIALIGCLTSSEYIHTRTGLVVLTRLVDVFPTRPALGNKILDDLKPLQDEDSPRPDIRAAANAYGMKLIQARDSGKWKEEDKKVAQARAKKEKAEAEERKKQREVQMKELAKDTEQITEKIGPRDGPRDRERANDRGNDRRRGGERDYPARTSRSPSENGRAPDRSLGTSSFARMAESGELAHNGRDGGRDGSRDWDRRRPRDDRHSSRDRDLDDRDRRRDSRDHDYDRDREVGRGDRHWPRDRDPSDRQASSGGGRAVKRRLPTPEDDRDADRGSSKRARVEPDSYSARRDGGRGDSPGRRPPSLEPPPSRSSRPPSRRNGPRR